MSQDSIEQYTPYNEKVEYQADKPIIRDLPSAINYIKHLTSQLNHQ